MATRCGVPVPNIISSPPFAASVIEVPRLYTAGLQNLFRNYSCPVCMFSLRVSVLM